MIGCRYDLTVVVTWTVLASEGPTRISRLPVSAPSLARARTMHTTGVPGSFRVTLIVTDTVWLSRTSYAPILPSTALPANR